MKARILFCLVVLSLFGCAKKEAPKLGTGLTRGRKPRVTAEEAEPAPEIEGAIRITSGDYYDCCPSWSPDGKSIAYSSYRGEGQNIWVIGLSLDAEGKLSSSGKPYQLTTGNFIDQDLSWSPDGRSIMFSSNRKGKYSIFLVRLEDKNIVDLKLMGMQPRWSPRGLKIVFVSMNNIWTAKVGVEKSERYVTVSGYNQHPSWFADGKELIFCSGGDLVRISEDGGPHTSLTSSGWSNQPDWSAERNEIIFVSNRGGNYDLWKTKPDGSDPVRLTDKPFSKCSPRWSPDGNWIAFQSDSSGSFDIWIMPSQKRVDS